MGLEVRKVSIRMSGDETAGRARESEGGRRKKDV